MSLLFYVEIGSTSLFAGGISWRQADGFGSVAGFNQPMGLTINKEGIVYVADTGNNMIRKIVPSGSLCDDVNDLFDSIIVRVCIIY